MAHTQKVNMHDITPPIRHTSRKNPISHHFSTNGRFEGNSVSNARWHRGLVVARGVAMLEIELLAYVTAGYLVFVLTSNHLYSIIYFLLLTGLASNIITKTIVKAVSHY